MSDESETKLIIDEIKALGHSEIAEHSQRFFKTGKGEYGEGDLFLGIRVPVLRKLAKSYRSASMETALSLLKSEYHEVRLFALYLLVTRFSKAEETEKRAIYKAYLDHASYVNNWDLVDSSAQQIVGGYLEDKDRSTLKELAVSALIWERRMAIIATFYFIRLNQFEDTIQISGILLNDPEDLIHKAVGWMLREVGNRDKAVEVAFLNRFYRQMPRTMLRYAIEKFTKDERQAYLKGEV